VTASHAALVAELAQARAVIGAVEGLHRPFTRQHEPGVGDECNECGPPWPCKTRAALRVSATEPGTEREDGADGALLMACDSLLSLIRHREPRLSEQTIRDLDALLPRLRRRTDGRD
jgi:hypothetical protein